MKYTIPLIFPIQNMPDIIELPRKSSSLTGASKMIYTKVHNSGLKNPKKCNIWHLPAKFGSTVAWICMCFARIVGGPLRPAALAVSAVQKL